MEIQKYYLVRTFFILLLVSCPIWSVGQMVTTGFNFKFENKEYKGVLDLPQNGGANSLVVLVSGSGPTDIIKENWNHKLRQMLTKIGIACYSYDKSGCGESEGEFDYNQPIENSSKELLAAVQELRDSKIPGFRNIGFWGISRAGWICPLAISEDPAIAFWISVSGPDHLENMLHLLKSNWAIEGRSEEEIEMLASEWLAGYKIAHDNGPFEEFLKARENFYKDPFVQYLDGGKAPTEERFKGFKKYLDESNIELDEKTGLGIVVLGFKELLNKIECPVLAIYGEKDSQVDWRSSKNLYQEALGSKGKLMVKTMPDCNHLMQTCQDCGMKESYQDLINLGLGYPCKGYYNAIEKWLLGQGFGKKQ